MLELRLCSSAPLGLFWFEFCWLPLVEFAAFAFEVLVDFLDEDELLSSKTFLSSLRVFVSKRVQKVVLINLNGAGGSVKWLISIAQAMVAQKRKAA